jgi:hypothetical protein
MCNVFKKIITENFPNLEQTMPIQVQEASGAPNRRDQNRTTPWNIIIKTSTETSERILEVVRDRKTNNIQSQTHQNHRKLPNRNIKNKKGMEWGLPSTEWK